MHRRIFKQDAYMHTIETNNFLKGSWHFMRKAQGHHDTVHLKSLILESAGVASGGHP